jgi:hypothetical protein
MTKNRAIMPFDTAHSTRFSARLGRLLVVAAVATGVAAAGAAPAGAQLPSTRSGNVLPQADLAVHLGTFGSMLIPRIRYDVSVTNNGPDTLDSATIIVQLDHSGAFRNDLAV